MLIPKVNRNEVYKSLFSEGANKSLYADTARAITVVHAARWRVHCKGAYTGASPERAGAAPSDHLATNGSRCSEGRAPFSASPSPPPAMAVGALAAVSAGRAVGLRPRHGLALALRPHRLVPR